MYIYNTFIIANNNFASFSCNKQWRIFEWALIIKSFDFLPSYGVRRRLTMPGFRGRLAQSKGARDPIIQNLPIGGIAEGCESRGNPYVKESDASEWDENSSRDKSPVMSRSIVPVTYRGKMTIVKYREFDPVARLFLRSITFAEILLPCIETCGIGLYLFDPYVIDDYHVTWKF